MLFTCIICGVQKNDHKDDWDYLGHGVGCIECCDKVAAIDPYPKKEPSDDTKNRETHG